MRFSCLLFMHPLCSIKECPESIEKENGIVVFLSRKEHNCQISLKEADV